MDIEKIKILIIDKLKLFVDENNLEITNINNDTRLIGSSGIFDSMDLVRFIVELEEELEDNFDIEITLADERAMSRSTSPFVNTITLSKYIIELIGK